MEVCFEILSGVKCGTAPRDVVARKFGVSMGGRLGRARRPNLAALPSPTADLRISNIISPELSVFVIVA